MFDGRISFRRDENIPIVSLPYSLPTSAVYHHHLPSNTLSLSPVVSDVRHPPPLDGCSILQQPQETVTLHSPHPSAPLLPSTMTNVLPPPSKFTRDQLVRNLQVSSPPPPIFSCSISVDASRSSAPSRLHYRLSYPSHLPCPVRPPHLPPINGNCPPPPIQKSSRGLVPSLLGHSKSSPQKMASSGKNLLPRRSRIRSSPQ